jgi:hypothetical protein
MPGFLFFDAELRLCMTLDDETIRRGHQVRAVAWVSEERRWSAPTRAVYMRPAGSPQLAVFDPVAVRTPVEAEGAAIWPIHWPGGAR